MRELLERRWKGAAYQQLLGFDGIVRVYAQLLGCEGDCLFQLRGQEHAHCPQQLQMALSSGHHS